MTVIALYVDPVIRDWIVTKVAVTEMDNRGRVTSADL